MNAYAVCIPEERCGPPRYDPPEPPECGVPCDVIVAETREQAKAFALRAWLQDLSMGVYSDDYPNIRVRHIEHGQGPNGEIGYDDGEFFHVLEAGKVRYGTSAYVQHLWSLWPEGWPAL